jgi:hypothetical protein
MPNPFNIINPDDQPDAAVNTTSQATLTFAGAPTAVTLVCSVLSTIIPSVVTGSAFPVILSLIVGMAIYATAPQPKGARHKTINFFFALINSFAIAATTLGISANLPGAAPRAPVANSTAPTPIVPVANPSISTSPSTR